MKNRLKKEKKRDNGKRNRRQNESNRMNYLYIQDNHRTLFSTFYHFLSNSSCTCCTCCTAACHRCGAHRFLHTPPSLSLQTPLLSLIIQLITPLLSVIEDLINSLQFIADSCGNRNSATRRKIPHDILRHIRPMCESS